MSGKTKLLILVCVLALSPSFILPCWGQRSPRGFGGSRLARSAPIFYADIAVFPGEGSNARAEVFLSIPLGSLGALGAENLKSKKGRAEVLVIFYNSSGDQITGDEWSYHNIPLGPTARENQGRVLNRRYTFELPPGKVEAKIQVSDVVRGLRNEKRLEFEVPDFSKENIRVSDPVYGLCSEMVASAPKGSFYGSVLPHPSRRYGSRLPGICIHYELADSNPMTEDYGIRYKLKSSFGETLMDTSFVVPRVGGKADLLLRPESAELVTGRYTVELEVRLGTFKVKKKSTFSIDESRMAFQQDPEKLRTIMKYVATNPEKARLESLPDDSLGVFWQEFWHRRDPDPTTDRNEALVQFLGRVEYAADQFGVLEPGWKSDRGRIYIKFGNPDQVEEFYTETYRYPTLIWYYYSRGRNYVFQDQEGFGRYRLVGMQED